MPPKAPESVARGARILRFLTVGVINTATDVAIFYVLFGLSGLIVASNVASYGCAGALSFVLNRGWTFGDINDSGAPARKITSFVVLNLVTLSLSTVLVLAFSEVWPVMVAKGVSVIITAAVSYTGMRYFVFGTKR